MTAQTKRLSERTDEQLAQYAEQVVSEDYDPDVVAVDDTRDLAAVADAADAVRAAEARLAEAVTVARAHERSWTRIGLALGVSRQAARQRYAQQVGD
ncbi:MAG: hypothetical protein ACOYBY_01220 [Dermatophilaceae bacterium]